jgi:predicted N-acetyltransferase YhbS
MPRGLRHNLPEVVPLTLLGRLAVDQRFQGMNIGKGMLKDGLSRALHASTIVGSRAVIVHAIDEEAVGFYTQFGFMKYPEGSLTLFLPMETIAQVIR